MSEAERRVNRRLTARITCHLTVSYRTNRDWHPATAMDLSPHGCRLRLGEHLKRGAAVTVRFAAPRVGSPAFEVRGRVIWDRLEGLSYQSGIHFAEEPESLSAVIAALAPSTSTAED